MRRILAVVFVLCVVSTPFSINDDIQKTFHGVTASFSRTPYEFAQVKKLSEKDKADDPSERHARAYETLSVRTYEDRDPEKKKAFLDAPYMKAYHDAKK